MSINDLNQLENNKDTSLELTNRSLSYLNETRKWTMFLAILGFVFLGIMVIFSLSFSAIFSSISGEEAKLPFPGFLIGFIYLILAVVYFFPILYLYKFSSFIKDGILNSSSDQLDLAFQNLKSHYKFMSILFIVMLAFYAFALFMVMVGGLFSML